MRLVVFPRNAGRAHAGSALRRRPGARRLRLDGAHRKSDHRSDVGHGCGRSTRRGAGLRNRAELRDVLLGDAQLDGLEAARQPESLRRPGGCPRPSRWRPPGSPPPGPRASLICCCRCASDALMTCCLSPSALLIAASRCAFRGQDHRALLALRAHLLFHRGEHVLRRRDVLDLVAQHLDAPRLRGLVELADDLRC